MDTTRQDLVFDPTRFNLAIDVIGAGAIGSYVTLSLAKLGINNIRVWDADKVEKHNACNQLYGPVHVGRLKVEALQQIVEMLTGSNLCIIPEFAGPTTKFHPITILCVDTMKARKEIFESIKLSANPLYIETRMGADIGWLFSFDPNDIEAIDKYEKTLYSDEKAERSACGTKISIGQTASIVANLAVWQFIKWFSNGRCRNPKLEFDTVIGLKPTNVFTTQLKGDVSCPDEELTAVSRSARRPAKSRTSRSTAKER